MIAGEEDSGGPIPETEMAPRMPRGRQHLQLAALKLQLSTVDEKVWEGREPGRSRVGGGLSLQRLGHRARPVAQQQLAGSGASEFGIGGQNSGGLPVAHPQGDEGSTRLPDLAGCAEMVAVEMSREQVADRLEPAPEPGERWGQHFPAAAV